MSRPTDFDDAVRDWLLDSAPASEPPQLLARVLAQTGATRRRPSWWSPRFGWTARLGQQVGTVPRAFAAVALVGLLLLLTLALVLAAGSRPKVPEPLSGVGLLVAARDGELWLYDVAGNARGHVTTGPFRGTGAWSRDGTRLARLDGTSGAPVLVISTPSLDDVLRLTLPAGAVPHLSWSPDGRRIAFGVEAGGSGRVYVVEIVAGATPVAITDIALGAAAPSWSPDGSLVAFRGGPESDRQVHVVGPDGTGVRVLTHAHLGVATSCSLSWSAGAGSIAFEAVGDGVWTVDADGGNEQRVTSPGASGRCPAISPDGRRITVVVDASDGARNVWVYELDRTVIGDTAVVHPFRELSPLEAARWPALWAPDGRSIVINGSALDGGSDPRQLVDADGSESPATFFTGDAVVHDWQPLLP